MRGEEGEGVVQAKMKVQGSRFGGIQGRVVVAVPGVRKLPPVHQQQD